MLSADVGVPARLSAGFGVILVTSHLPESRRGFALNVDAGQGAGRLSVGAIEYDYMGSAMQLRASVLRTWRDPWRVEANQTFVGPEIRFSPLVITFGIGYYWRTAGSAPGDDRFFAPTIGFRL